MEFLPFRRLFISKLQPIRRWLAGWKGWTWVRSAFDWSGFGIVLLLGRKRFEVAALVCGTRCYMLLVIFCDAMFIVLAMDQTWQSDIAEIMAQNTRAILGGRDADESSFPLAVSVLK